MLCSRVNSLGEIFSVNLQLAAYMLFPAKKKYIYTHNFLYHNGLIWFKKKDKRANLCRHPTLSLVWVSELLSLSWDLAAFIRRGMFVRHQHPLCLRFIPHHFVPQFHCATTYFFVNTYLFWLQLTHRLWFSCWFCSNVSSFSLSLISGLLVLVHSPGLGLMVWLLHFNFSPDYHSHTM